MQDLREAEWRMKSLHWQKMQKNLSSGDILDQLDYDVKYSEMDIDITDISGQTITGKVTMTSESVINGLAEVDYDFHNALTVDSVRMNNQAVYYNHSDNVLSVTFGNTYNTGEEFTTVVYYHGHPNSSGFGSFVWSSHQGDPIICTMSCPEGSRDWWPCKDQPGDKIDSVDVIMTAPDDLVATSNGAMVSDINNGNGTGVPSGTYFYRLTVDSKAVTKRMALIK